MIRLAESMLDLHGGQIFRQAVDDAERRSFAFGETSLWAAVRERRFSLLIVSSPLSLGATAKPARAFFDFLDSYEVAVFAGVCQLLDRNNLDDFHKHWLGHE